MSNKNPVIFLTGKKVYLRPTNKETDLPLLQRWINDPKIRKYLTTYLPITTVDEANWLDKIAKKDPNNIHVAIMTKTENTLIGYMGLHGINYQHGTATTGAMIGEHSYIGKGYGFDAKMIFLYYAFNTLNLRKINSSAKSFNGRSVAYNLKCGYIKEGIRKGQFLHNRKPVDEVMLAATYETWLPKWKEYIKGYEKEILV